MPVVVATKNDNMDNTRKPTTQKQKQNQTTTDPPPPQKVVIKDENPSASSSPTTTSSSSSSRLAVEELKKFLQATSSSSSSSTTNDNKLLLEEQSFASIALTYHDGQLAKELLWQYHVERIRKERSNEIANQHVILEQKRGDETTKVITMKYFSKFYHPTTIFTATTTNTNTPKKKGKKTTKKIPLFIGLHGGGGCPPSVNDQQWENHKRLYDATYQEIANSIQSTILYIAPRAPTNNWNLWHESHIDLLFDRLIETLLVTTTTATTTTTHTNNNDTNEDVDIDVVIDVDRIYISGYSAGGDGIYMLAPRMADRFAAASMMAGHPNGVSLRGIYNLPFTLQVGGKDSAYNRNTVGKQYKESLQDWKRLEQDEEKEQKQRQPVNLRGGSGDGGREDGDGGGYQHVWAKIYDDYGHGLGGQDAIAMKWMGNYTRNTNPKTLVWDKDSARHPRFYWVLRSTTGNNIKQCRCGGGEVRVTREGQTIVIDLSKCPQSSMMQPLTLRFNDTMLDMDKPVTIYRQDNDNDDNNNNNNNNNGNKDEKRRRRQLLQEVQLSRTIGTLYQTLKERGDPSAVYSAQVMIDPQITIVKEEEKKEEVEAVDPQPTTKRLRQEIKATAS